MRSLTFAPPLLFGLMVGPLPCVGQDGPSPAAMPTVAAFRADLVVMRTQFMGRDRSYSPAARAQAEARLAALEAGLDTIDRLRFELEVMRIVALADNGHTSTPAGMRARRYNRIPLRLVPLGSDFHVLRARASDADLLGARLVAIDQRSIAEVTTVGRTLAGGTPAWRDRIVPFLLESPEQLHALGVIAQHDAATYHFALADGRRVSRRLVASAPDPADPPMRPSRWMYPEQPAGAGDWRTMHGVEHAPWSLRDPGVPFRWRPAPEIDAVVIELRQNHDAPNRPIAAFLAEADSVIRHHKPRHVVLDMRMNGGGDLNTTRDFMQRLPTLVPGRIFALTSPWTFSAAISSVGYLEQAAPDRVTIVGEGVGDRLEFWAEGQPITLPRTGIMIGLATERHDYATGCRPFKDCHGSVVRSPISVRTLTPDIVAPWTIEGYRSGRDPAMDAVAAALRPVP